MQEPLESMPTNVTDPGVGRITSDQVPTFLRTENAPLQEWKSPSPSTKEFNKETKNHSKGSLLHRQGHQLE